MSEDSDAATAERHRSIRSFVLRQGRTTDAQRDALARDWPRFGLDWPQPMAAPTTWFATQRPVVLEIGFGNGEALVAAAKADPGRDYLGIEVHRPGVGRLLRGAAAADLDNLKVISEDAVVVLREGIATASLDEVRLYFPDPWPKKRHHKRRIVQTPFVELVASRLRPGGHFHLATDWQEYALWMREVLDPCPLFANTAGPDGYVECPPGRIETHFERRGRKLGHGVWDLLYQRC
jgi:tRNA (guanine-N7-)-methyltransferase